MLTTRVITAIVALIVLGAILFVIPARAAELVIAAIVIAGAWEWSAFLTGSANIVRTAFVIGIAAAIVAVYGVLPGFANLTLQIACAWWCCAFLWTLFFPTPIPAAVRWLAGALVLIPMFVALIMLYRMGPEVLLFALLIVWAADAGAFFAGKLFGRVKLAPSISPGKAWEGVFGGLSVVAALAVATAYWTDIDLAVLLPFCLAVAALSIVGDLTVSMFKRTAGLKDSGKLFPGHGGVLDRVDSVAAAAPLFALGVGWLGLIR
ncbi:MAG: phosphatidate cytidylyltransferase [Woeseiaceae bacterium]